MSYFSSMARSKPETRSEASDAPERYSTIT